MTGSSEKPGSKPAVSQVAQDLVRAGVLLVVLICFVPVGTWVTKVLIRPETNFVGSEIAVGQVTNRALLNAFLACGDSKMMQLATVRTKVTSLWKSSGHCPREAEDSTAAYVARVSFYTIFAIPIASVTLNCGGEGYDTIVCS